MDNLLTKAYNSYVTYISNLAFGQTEQKYNLLYEALLVIKNNISNPRIVQYYENNL